MTIRLNTRCPWCGTDFDKATGLVEKAPVAGDLTVCARCLNVAEFDASIQLRQIDESTLEPSDLKGIQLVRYMLVARVPRTQN